MGLEGAELEGVGLCVVELEGVGLHVVELEGAGLEGDTLPFTARDFSNSPLCVHSQAVAFSL